MEAVLDGPVRPCGAQTGLRRERTGRGVIVVRRARGAVPADPGTLQTRLQTRTTRGLLRPLRRAPAMNPFLPRAPRFLFKCDSPACRPRARGCGLKRWGCACPTRSRRGHGSDRGRRRPTRPPLGQRVFGQGGRRCGLGGGLRRRALGRGHRGSARTGPIVRATRAWGARRVVRTPTTFSELSVARRFR